MKHFALFSNCIPVKGIKRSLICDLQFGKYWFIPNPLCDFLLDLQNSGDAESSKTIFRIASPQILKQLNLLVELRLGHYVSTNDELHFVQLDKKWYEPARITNSIIDVRINSNHNYTKLFSELTSLGCKNIQFRIYHAITLNELVSILEKTNNTRINHIEIIIRYSSEYSHASCEKLLANFKRIVSMFIYSSSPLLAEDGQSNDRVFFSNLELEPHKHCGEITPSYFTCNNQAYMESLNFNTCLNRKLSIDHNGDICNCPSMKDKYGNHHSKELKQVLDDLNFTKLWSVNKDKIKICSSCEFRYICTDCRAFISDPSDELSKPLKCGYDPQNAVWEDWSLSQLNKEAIDFYQLSSE